MQTAYECMQLGVSCCHKVLFASHKIAVILGIEIQKIQIFFTAYAPGTESLLKRETVGVCNIMP